MKKIVMALALGILGTTGAIGVGCGKDACATYGDDLLAKYDECGIAATSGGSGSSATATCTEDDAKLLGCCSTSSPKWTACASRTRGQHVRSRSEAVHEMYGRLRLGRLTRRGDSVAAALVLSCLRPLVRS